MIYKVKIGVAVVATEESYTSCTNYSFEIKCKSIPNKMG